MHSLAQAERQIATDWFLDELGSATISSQGQVAMVERSAPEGFMAPLVRRDEDETYRVTEGEILFFVGGDMVWAEAGDVVVAPRGVPRTFRAGRGGANWLVLTRVASLERFVDFGRAVSIPLGNPAAGWPSAGERSTVAAMGAANGIELLGPPGALPSL
jgi:mannose-6-phosphate isomerase-like protein (cupin superfamily)